MDFSPLLFKELDRLIANVAEDADLRPHDESIKPVWRKDVFRWARERLRLPIKRWTSYAPSHYRDHKWDGTKEPLAAAAKALCDGYSCGVSSSTGIGKTFWAAVITLWFLDCWEGSQVITMAPKEDQLTLNMWKEIGRLWPLFKKLHPKAELQHLHIKMRPQTTAIKVDDLGIPVGMTGWGAVGFACGVAADEAVANRARGFHAEHMLFILEETTGVHPSILSAVRFTCTAPHNLRLFLGNPDSKSDGLAQSMAEPGVVSVRGSSLDHPNVVTGDPNLIPGAISLTKVKQLAELYGEENRLYKSRVRGIVPGEGTDALIKHEWLVASAERWKQNDPARSQGVSAIGADCANSPAGDKACRARGKGKRLLELKSEQTPDTNQWGRLQLWPYIESGMVDPRKVAIDVDGVGVGCYNELKRLGAWCAEIHGGGKVWPTDSEHVEQFKDLRSQMYWQLRCDLQKGEVDLPDDPELWEDLLEPEWWTKAGKIVIESKEDFKDRLPGRRSPDKGDAVVYWNWIRQADKAIDFSTFDTKAVAF